MKICIITNTFSTDLIGGSNIYTQIIAEELRNRNHEVVVITASSDKKKSIKIKDGIKIQSFNPTNVSISSEAGNKSTLRQGLWSVLDIYNYHTYLKLIKILKEENPDVVHLHTPTDVTLSVFTAVKKLKLPLIFTVHDYLLLCRRFILLHKNGKICTKKNINKLCQSYRLLTRNIIGNKPDVVIFPSEFILRMFDEQGFFQKTKKVILPNPIRLNNIDSGKKNTVIRKPGLNILYVGSLTRHKGIQILIEALKLIKNDFVRLAVVGSGRYKNKLENLAGADQRITFHGQIPNSEIESYYNESDLLVVPSISNEIFGIVILEAFRAGIPVIASRIGGIPEIVKNNYNGFLFEPGDIQQLKQILENLIKNPDILVELGNYAKDDLKQYEVSRHIQRLILNYQEAIRLNRMRCEK